MPRCQAHPCQKQAHEDSAWSGDLRFKKEEKRGAPRARTAGDSSPGQTLEEGPAGWDESQSRQGGDPVPVEARDPPAGTPAGVCILLMDRSSFSMLGR